MKRPRELSSFVEMFSARTPTLPPATHTNSYAIGAREVVLVEPATPFEDEQRAWIDWARSLPSTGRTAIAIFATHHHPDHMGGAAFLAKELALPVWAHRETASRVDVPVARMLDEGEHIVLEGPVPSRWRVLFTPGHAPGHLCLFEENSRTVIVGDMVASTGTILIARGDGDMRIYLRELARLRALNARLALPAHGDPIDDPSKLFAYYIDHRLKRENKVVEAIKKLTTSPPTSPPTPSPNPHPPTPSPLPSPRDILPLVYDDVSPALFPIALLSLETHLDKLVADGVAIEKDGAYRLAGS